MTRRWLLVSSFVLVAALGAALALSTAGSDASAAGLAPGASAPSSAPPDRGAPAPDAAAAACGTQPPPMPCTRWVCTIDGWTDVPLANGTSCNDGDPCTYRDVCTNGLCAGTWISCTRPCEACSGGSTCSLRAAGTTCPASTNPCEAVCDGVSPYCQPR
jgi:hypothetical protein